MPRMKKMVEREDGWCDWQAPLLKGYRMGCCDCGLVHDMEFKVIKITKYKKNGYFTYEEIPEKNGKEKFRILMRAKRNKRSTSAMRRKK